MQVSAVEESAGKVADYDCPVEATLGGKSKVVILYHLTHDGTHRFAVLRRKIPGVSERMLTQQLRELEVHGIVQREVYTEVPPKVEYSLTDYGKSLRPITAFMCEWGQRHMRWITAKKRSESAGS